MGLGREGGRGGGRFSVPSPLRVVMQAINNSKNSSYGQIFQQKRVERLTRHNA